LQAERQVRDDYDRFLREQPPQLSPDERARIAALSGDVHGLWLVFDSSSSEFDVSPFAMGRHSPRT
jgi:hypothetical protein